MSKNRARFAESLMKRNTLSTFDPDCDYRDPREFNVLPGPRKGTVTLVWNCDGGFPADVKDMGLERAIGFHYYGDFSAASLLTALEMAQMGQSSAVRFLFRPADRPTRVLRFESLTPATIVVKAPCRETREVRVSAIRRAINKVA